MTTRKEEYKCIICGKSIWWFQDHDLKSTYKEYYYCGSERFYLVIGRWFHTKCVKKCKPVI